MADRDNGGAAFPWCGDLNECPTINLGMSLRDYIATHAMAAMLANPSLAGPGKRTSDDGLIRDAYAAADRMLAERAK